MSLIDQLDKYYSSSQITVIRDELKFCHRLGIGEKAYASLRHRENLRNTVEAVGIGAMASGAMASSVVATTFFGGSGWLAAAGLATAATPVGWVIGAGLAVGGGYLGLVKLLEEPKDSGVVVIPKHINTPLDLLASTLLDFYLPLGLKFSWLDNHSSEDEQQAMVFYLTEQWGYSEAFLEQNLPLFSQLAQQVDITDVVTRYIEFAKNNPDCDLSSLHEYTMGYLRAIVEADGVVSDEEKIALDAVNQLFVSASDSAKLKTAVVDAKNTFTISAANSTKVFIGTSRNVAFKAFQLGSDTMAETTRLGTKGVVNVKAASSSAVNAAGEIAKKGTNTVKGLMSSVSGKTSELTNRIGKKIQE